MLFWQIDRKQRINRNEAYARAEAERLREEERFAKQREEDERIRKERMEAMAKDDAVRILQRWVGREETSLKELIEECKIKLDMLNVDERSLDDELAALEKEEVRKAEDAKRRSIKRRDKVDRVDALLSSPTLNRLSNTYLGESLHVTLADFRSHIGNLVKISDEKTRRYAENRAKYQKSVKDADKEVDRLTREAGHQLEVYEGKQTGNVKYLRKRVESLREEIAKLEHKEKITTLNKSEKTRLKSLCEQLPIYESQLNSSETTSSLGAATKTLHKVNIAEANARRTYDTALSVRQDDDNAVEAEINREIDIFNAAKLYEVRAMDRIRDAMKQRGIALFEKKAMAEKKLKYLGDAVVNLDMLKADEVEQLRKKMAQKLSDGMTFEVRD